MRQLRLNTFASTPAPRSSCRCAPSLPSSAKRYGPDKVRLSGYPVAAVSAATTPAVSTSANAHRCVHRRRKTIKPPFYPGST